MSLDVHQVPRLLGVATRFSFGTVKFDILRDPSSFYDSSRISDGDDMPFNQAHIKVYRRVAWDPYIFNRRPEIDFAAGISAGTHESIVQPKCRLRYVGSGM